MQTLHRALRFHKSGKLGQRDRTVMCNFTRTWHHQNAKQIRKVQVLNKSRNCQYSHNLKRKENLYAIVTTFCQRVSGPLAAAATSLTEYQCVQWTRQSSGTQLWSVKYFPLNTHFLQFGQIHQVHQHLTSSHLTKVSPRVFFYSKTVIFSTYVNDLFLIYNLFFIFHVSCIVTWNIKMWKLSKNNRIIYIRYMYNINWVRHGY